MSQYCKYSSNYVDSSRHDKSVPQSKYADDVYNRQYGSYLL